MLCDSCTSTLQEIFAETHEDDRYDKKFTIHETIQHFQIAARNGCYICSKVFEALEKEVGPALFTTEFDKPLEVRIPPPPMPKPTTLSFDIVYCSESPYPSWYYCLVPFSSGGDDYGFTFNDISSLTACIAHKSYPTIPSSTRSLEVGDLARTWYHQCQKEHGTSCYPSETDFFPPRALDITTSPPRLVFKEEVDILSDFAALSHCWGQEVFLTLTSSNIQDLREGNIAQERIPKNFCDAIEICRSLRIRYLWIDSLCIIQDGDGSLEDWKQHVQIMWQVYANSAVCISTAAAAGAMQACLQERNARTIEPTAISFNGNPYIVTDVYHTIRGFQDTPIATRGWVFQERMLSKRVLTLGQQQILWECHETARKGVCETFPSGLDAPYAQRGPFSLPQSPPGTPDPRRSRETRELWQNLIETYCTLQLKYDNNDKFAAFAGIARHMHTVFGGPGKSDYVAGFFDFELPAALLWYIDFRKEPKFRPDPSPGLYRAPSWSWASSNTRVTLSTLYNPAKYLCPRHEGHLAELISCSVVPVDLLSPYGQLKHASLRLRAYLLPFRWDTTSPRDFFKRIKTYSMPGSDFAKRSINTWFDSEADYEGNSNNAFVLPIQKHDWDDDVEGLIVRPVSPNQAEYRRIGRMKFGINVEAFFAWLKENGTQEVVLV